MANSSSGPSYAGLSVVIGIVSIAVGGGYWYWEYSRRKQKEKEREEREAARDPLDADAQRAFQLAHPGTSVTPALPVVTPLPQIAPPKPPAAQEIPVPPPTTATIMQAQHSLNVISGKVKGQPGYLNEDGSAGPKTGDAIQKFQTQQGMAPTGKLDGMTQSMLALIATHTATRRRTLPAVRVAPAPPISFILSWDQATHNWVAKDSLGFVVIITGYNVRNKYPSADVVVAQLIKHYGAASTVGKALAQGQYGWDCPDCAAVKAPTVSGDFSTYDFSWAAPEFQPEPMLDEWGMFVAPPPPPIASPDDWAMYIPWSQW